MNFYPFEDAISKTNHNNILENIDIGGPTMVRAAAKNYNDVVVICNPNQYERFINEIKTNKGSTSLSFREKLAEEAFMETAYYESKISEYFNKKTSNIFPQKKIFFYKLITQTRYGENPHQKAAIYSKNGYQDIIQLSGKNLSYNNYNDLYSALNVTDFLPNNRGIAIIKHANPCGVSINQNKIKSFKEALESDPISAFGELFRVILNEYKFSKRNKKIYFEIIMAKGFDKKSINLLKEKI